MLRVRNTDADLVLHCATELLGRSLNADDVFFDLGSGDGRLVLYLALLTKARRSVGWSLPDAPRKRSLRRPKLVDVGFLRRGDVV